MIHTFLNSLVKSQFNSILKLKIPFWYHMILLLFKLYQSYLFLLSRSMLLSSCTVPRLVRELSAILENLKFRASHNLLEYLAAIISPWVDILVRHLQLQDCVLSMTDSTTAEGWLKQLNFSELGKIPIQASVQIESAQKQTTLFTSLGIKSYS